MGACHAKSAPISPESSCGSGSFGIDRSLGVDRRVRNASKRTVLGRTVTLPAIPMGPARASSTKKPVAPVPLPSMNTLLERSPKSKSTSTLKVGNSTTSLKPSPRLNCDMFVANKSGDIRDWYDMDADLLGEGGYGSVCRARHRVTSAQRAIKTIAKRGLKDMETFRQEIRIMSMVDHPHIIKLFETFADKRHVYLVMELCTGGELFDSILDAGSFSEVHAAILMQQMMRAVYYMHERNICHRDIKPENFLLQESGPIEKSNLKLIDFGLSKVFKPDEMMKTKVGTPYYVSPQVLSGSYCKASDIWSCGVIMFIFLCGYPPFSGESDNEVLSAIRKGCFSFQSDDWKDITDDAKILIRGMLRVSVNERITAEQVLSHSWITDKAPKALPGISLKADFVSNLRGFQSASHFKKAALHVIAGELSEQQIKSLRDMFVALDANGDGRLTVEEIRAGLMSGGLAELPADLNQIVADVDANASGVIDYTEFLAATLQKKLYIQEDVCWKAFAAFDQNGDGKISLSELAQVLSNGSVEEALGSDAIVDLMREVDGNGDGMIDFDEFMNMMRNNGTPCHKSQGSHSFGL